MMMTEAVVPARHISLSAAVLIGARKTKSSPLMTLNLINLATTLTLTAITPSWERRMMMTQAIILIPARHISLNAAVLIGARKTKSSPLMPPLMIISASLLPLTVIMPSWGHIMRGRKRVC